MPRRRLSIDDRRAQLLRACLEVLGARPWADVSMAEIAESAGVSKPLLYHYFATKSALYVATVAWAADELRMATRPDPSLPPGQRARAALDAHLDWIDSHGLAYRAIIQGGISSDDEVHVIVERSRAEVVERLAEIYHVSGLSAAQRILCRGWVGFLEAASLEWLTSRTISRHELAQLLEDSLAYLMPHLGTLRHDEGRSIVRGPR